MRISALFAVVRCLYVRLSVMFVYCIAVYDKDLDLTYTLILLDYIQAWPKVQFCTFICYKNLTRLRPETFSQCRTRRTLHVVRAMSRKISLNAPNTCNVFRW